MSARTDGAASCRTIIVTQHCPVGMRKRDVWRVDQFHLLRKVGSGYASTVYLGTCRTTGNQVAVKLYHKNKLSELNHFQVAREITIHSGLDHKHIIQLWAAFEDQYGIYLVFEYASKGDVFTEVERRGGQLNEAESVRQVIYPFLSALEYLHSNYIIHRDIKPENLLFTATGVLKVGDFGLSINFSQERPVTRVGTLDYMAPEVVVCPDKHRPHDHKEMKHLYYTPLVDAWAVGVLAYELIVGRPPFDKGQKKATINEILNGEPFLPPWLSEGAVHFIRWALTKDQQKRPSVLQLMEHPWVASHMKQAALASARRQLVKTDSFVEPRQLGFRGSNAPAASEQSPPTGGGREPPRPLQVSSVSQGGRQLGHSNSMSAVDGMRFRDVNIDSVTNGMASTAEAALNAVKRVSDGDGTTGGRPSAAGGRVSRAGTARNSGAGGVPVSRLGGLNAAAAAAALAAVAAEEAAAATAASAAASTAAAAAAAAAQRNGRPMTREELLASLTSPHSGRGLGLQTMRSFTAGRPTPLVQSAVAGAMMRTSSGGGASASAGGSVTVHGMRPVHPPPAAMSPLARSGSPFNSSSAIAAAVAAAAQDPLPAATAAAAAPPPHHPASPLSAACPSADLALELGRLRVDSQQSLLASSGSAPYSPKPATPLRPQPPQAPSPSARGLKSGSPLIPSRLSQSFTSPISPLAAAGAGGAGGAGVGAGAQHHLQPSQHVPSRLGQQSSSGAPHPRESTSSSAAAAAAGLAAAAAAGQHDASGNPKVSGVGAAPAAAAAASLSNSAPVPSAAPPDLPGASPGGVRTVGDSSGGAAAAAAAAASPRAHSPYAYGSPRELPGERDDFFFDEREELAAAGGGTGGSAGGGGGSSSAGSGPGSGAMDRKSPSFKASKGLFGSFKRVFS